MSTPLIQASNYESILEFSNAFQTAFQKDETAFLLIDGKLYSVATAEVAREHIAEKIAKRIAEQPTILHDIQTRLETEEPEEWE